MMAALSSNASDLPQQRFTGDVTDQSAPISGLFDSANPVLPLYEAVLRFSSFIGDDLAPEIHRANNRMKTPHAVKAMKDYNVTLDEVCESHSLCSKSTDCISFHQGKAIFLYTSESPLYETLNRCLRSSDREMTSMKKPLFAFRLH